VSLRVSYPDWLAVYRTGGTGNDDTDKGSQRKPDGNRKQLGPESISRLLGETSKIRIIDNQSGKVGNAIHNSGNNRPRLCTAGNGRTSMNDGTNSAGLDDGPNHKENAGDGDSIRFDSE